MKYRLLDLLACPICKNFPLELIVFEELESPAKFKWSVCELYCGFLKRKVDEVEEFKCEECFKKEVKEGLLICEKCLRWYPIIDEIPHMLPDELRDRVEDLTFLKKHSDKIPKRVLEAGKPVNLLKEIQS